MYDYFDGKTEHLEGPGLTGRKYWAYYEGWLVKELEGESAELARRMLVVISKIRSEGMIGASYRIKADAEKYARFLPALVSTAKQSGGDYMIALLYYSYMLVTNSPRSRPYPGYITRYGLSGRTHKTRNLSTA